MDQQAKLIEQFKKIDRNIYVRMIELREYAKEDEDCTYRDIPIGPLKAFLLFCKTFKFDRNKVSIALTPDNEIYLEIRIKKKEMLGIRFDVYGVDVKAANRDNFSEVKGCYIDSSKNGN